MMKLGGLKKLARILDESIDDIGVAMIFRFMDVDSDGEISLEEFKAALEVWAPKIRKFNNINNNNKLFSIHFIKSFLKRNKD